MVSLKLKWALPALLAIAASAHAEDIAVMRPLHVRYNPPVEQQAVSPPTAEPVAVPSPTHSSIPYASEMLDKEKYGQYVALFTAGDRAEWVQQNAERYPQYKPLLEQAAAQHNIPSSLLAATVAVESGFDPRARSRKDARGLLQIRPISAKEWGCDSSQLYDAEHNVECAAPKLAEYRNRFGNWEAALTAWHSGPNRNLTDGDWVAELGPRGREYAPQVFAMQTVLFPEPIAPASAPTMPVPAVQVGYGEFGMPQSITTNVFPYSSDGSAVNLDKYTFAARQGDTATTVMDRFLIDKYAPSQRSGLQIFLNPETDRFRPGQMITLVAVLPGRSEDL